MGVLNDFFGGKKAPNDQKLVSKYREFDRYGKLGMKKQLWNVDRKDREKMKEMFKKHGGLENARQMSNRQISKMMKDELGIGPAAVRFRQRIKDKVLSKKEIVATGPTEEERKAHILSFRYDRAAEEEAKNRKGPQFANLPRVRHSIKESSKSSQTANPVGIRGNNPADRAPQRELKDNPHLGL
ncbi:MAG: hypothetical protein V1865_00580 [bacterium]